LAGWKNYQNPYFEDENQVMNLSVKDIDGDIVVSQFYLQAIDHLHIKAAKPDVAIPLYKALFSS
jgi:D-tyrosyl-tRNA(Tyr) deacylase